MIRFILNNKEVSTSLPPGTLLLDYIRYHQKLTGSKIGCREGDCGACTVIMGELKDENLEYRTATSCLTALGNVQGKHVVTIEGLNLESKLNPIQQAMAEEGATQCGFCTPGFVVSISGFCLRSVNPTQENLLAAVDGNICRCTGYKSIERAISKVGKLLDTRSEVDAITFAADNQLIPAYFLGIRERLSALRQAVDGFLSNSTNRSRVLGGGTDLYVQQHEAMVHADIAFLNNRSDLKGISRSGDRCEIAGAATVTDLLEAPLFQQCFPNYKEFIKLISSTPIRNIATIGGNLVNASPIGDLSIFFLALDALVHLSSESGSRAVPLRQFYLGYKKLGKQPVEIIEKISFKIPQSQSSVHFEKVCKRTYLDIASVNSAFYVRVEGGHVIEAGLSVGGVGPIPLFLARCSEFLIGKAPNQYVLEELLKLADTEISPISDVRGSESYKRKLTSQLIKSHFITHFKEVTFIL